jgi:gliding motility-associated-like protein
MIKTTSIKANFQIVKNIIMQKLFSVFYLVTNTATTFAQKYFPKKLFTTFLIFVLSVTFYVPIQAQINGVVFKDWNGDGLWQQGVEPTAQGVFITAFDVNNVQVSNTVSASNGTYSLPYTVPIRVEYSVGNSACLDSNFMYNVIGTNGNNVRFFNANASNENFGIQNTSEYYIQTDPTVYSVKLNRGDPLVTGAAANETALMGFPYSTVQIGSAPINAPNKQFADKIGCTWGLAYNKKSKQMFTSAFVKRISGLGSLGSGGIYKLEHNAVGGFNVTDFYDMDTAGNRTRAANNVLPYGLNSSYILNATNTIATYQGTIDTASGEPIGLGVIGSNLQRGLNNTLNASVYDAAAFDQVGKVGIGDIEFSDDGKFLFVMNLYDRKLYRLELDNAFNPQKVIQTKRYSLPLVATPNGKLRGFAITFHNNKIYVGAVGTAENGGTVADMKAFVFEFLNPTENAIFNPNPVLTIPLSYTKGFALNNIAGTNVWYPWNKNTANIIADGDETLPTPILSNIAFTDNGDLIIDLMDRSGHQHGYLTYRDLDVSTYALSYAVGGDVLIAGYNCNTNAFTIENNGSYISQGTTYNSNFGIGNGEGIGGGEFFEPDNYLTDHFETSVGSLAIIPRKNEVLASMMDPIDAFTNGIKKLNITNGTSNDELVLCDNMEFGKANSLGDIEIAGDCLPLHIGNRVWMDNNGNGIQDANEMGIANVELDLYTDFNKDNIPDGLAIASTQTDANGIYSFNELNIIDGDPFTTGNQPGISSYSQYLIRIASTDWTGGNGINDLLGLHPTLYKANSTITFLPEIRDNNAFLSTAGTIDLIVQSKMNGKNDFNNDFGFSTCSTLVLDSVLIDCDNTSKSIGIINPDPNQTYSWMPSVGLSNANIGNPVANPSVTTIYTLTINGNCNAVQKVVVDNEKPIAEAGSDKKIDCINNTNGVLIGTDSINGNLYTWMPPNGLNNSTIAMPFANPEKSTTYTLSCTGINGCTNTSTVFVMVDKCCSKIFLPNSFSPNGDGYNDQFKIIGIASLNNFRFVVFNRFGEVVFENKNDKSKLWDGTYKGRSLDIGTYFYYLEYDCPSINEKTFLKGDISLIR